MKKIKILHLLDSLCIGGMENMVIGLCNNLDSARFDVTLLILSGDHIDLKSKIQSHIRLITLPLSYRTIMNPLILLCLTPYLIQKIHAIKVDIVHTHCYQSRLFSLLMALLFSNRHAAFFHTIHTSGLHYQNRNLWDNLKIKLEKVCNRVCKINLIAVSDAVYLKCKPLLRYSYHSFMCINNGVDTNLKDIPKSNIIDCKCLNIIYVSRLHTGKNHRLLLEAFAQVVTVKQDIRLYLLGDGEQRQSILNEVANLNIAKNIVLLGNRNDVLSILKSCDIGVFPSLFEGLSLALLEMMAAGLPIICSDIPEFRQIFSCDSDALFFDPASSDELYNAIRFLCETPIERSRLSQRSQIIVKKYSLNQMAHKYQERYNTIIKIEQKLHSKKHFVFKCNLFK